VGVYACCLIAASIPKETAALGRQYCSYSTYPEAVTSEEVLEGVFDDPLPPPSGVNHRPLRCEDANVPEIVIEQRTVPADNKDQVSGTDPFYRNRFCTLKLKKVIRERHLER
jgi:hypothetical protein